jgi:D-3-phosphoglycerate dehydrogenase
MAATILVTEPLADAGLALLRARHTVVLALNPPLDELLQRVAACDALIVRSSTRVTAEVLAAARYLQVVGRAGSGVDNIDVEAATRHGVLVINAPEANTVAVAEHTLALMLAFARHIPEATAGLREGRWEKKRLMGSELLDKTLGLVGLGRVGGAVARRAAAFGMHLLAYDPFVAPERAAQMGVELVSLDDLLARSDYVSLHAPGGERTRGLIDAAALARMKPGAVLINCARGDLVVQEALCEALCSGALGGAALDVFPDEPHVDADLRACPNLLLTPHLGASTAEAQTSAGLEVARQVLDVLDGRPARYR